MYVEAICPLCLARHVVPADMRGEKYRCEECEEVFIVSRKAKKTDKRPSRPPEVQPADELGEVIPVEEAEVLPEAKLLLLDSPSALFLAVKTGRAQAFAIDKPIADFYEAENQDLVRLDTSGTPFAYVSQDLIFMKPGDFKWWLFLDTWVGEFRSGSRYEKYEELYRKWMKREPPPQRFYDYNKF